MEMSKYSEDLIQSYLFGYRDIRLVSSEDVLNTLQKDLSRNGHRLPESPPLSPKKIRTPDEVSLCTSSIPGAIFGACAIKRIHHGTWFGPFEGKLVRTTEITEGINNEYMWEIFHDGEVSHYLDGYNENNWMSLVRCARHKKEQNLVVFQYHGCIYYRTIKDVLPGSELLVWYDAKYTQLLGIPLAWNDNRTSSNKRKANHLESDGTSKKRKNDVQIPLLQKLERKVSPRRQQSDLDTLLEVTKKLDQRNISLDLSPTIPLRCEKCLFNFHSKDQLTNHNCLATPTLRLPSMEKKFSRFPLMEKAGMPSVVEKSFLRLPSMEKLRMEQFRLPNLDTRLPNIDKLRDLSNMDKLRENPFARPMTINMPYTDPISYYQNYFSNQYYQHYYPSPPLDPVKHLACSNSLSAHRVAPIPLKNY